MAIEIGQKDSNMTFVVANGGDALTEENRRAVHGLLGFSEMHRQHIVTVESEWHRIRSEGVGAQQADDVPATVVSSTFRHPPSPVLMTSLSTPLLCSNTSSCSRS